MAFWEDKRVSELAAKVPSKDIAVPLTPVFITGEVKVLFVKTWDWEFVMISLEAPSK